MPTKFKALPPVEYLRECFSLCRKTGILTWKERPPSHFENTPGVHAWWNPRHANKKAGHPDHKGYLVVKIDGQAFKVHRLVWKLLYGCDPAAEIDHINGDKSDNREINLREASSQQNRRNTPAFKHSKTGIKGVWVQSGRFKSCIFMEGKQIYLGYFDTAEEARAAYEKMAKGLHGEFFFSPCQE
jgi:hypothetical protein